MVLTVLCAVVGTGLSCTAVRPNLTLIWPRTVFKTQLAYTGFASVSPDDVFARDGGGEDVREREAASGAGAWRGLGRRPADQ